MDFAQADALAARNHVRADGWIARKAESFRHLPPPPAPVWLPADDTAPFDEAAALADGWTITMLPGGPSDVEARWFDAADPGQRFQLLDGLAAPGADEAAPFAWAHRALVRQGLRLRIAPAPGGAVTWLRIERHACAPVEAPLLRIEMLPGARCVLLETHERAGMQNASAQAGAPGNSVPKETGQAPTAVVQNLLVDVRLGEGAQLQHLRHVAPAEGDRVAHHLHARIAQDARYAQALLASGSDYHLQRNVFDLEGARSSANAGGVLLASGTGLEQQLLARHAAGATQSAAEVLALGGRGARLVANAYTRIAPGCDEAATRQRLVGIPTSGQPRIVLRPHLEIHHDQVQAAHGAAWGALPEDALFHARQRGLDETAAKALIVEGQARALLARAIDDAQVPEALQLETALEAAVARHLASAQASIAREAHHG